MGTDFRKINTAELREGDQFSDPLPDAPYHLLTVKSISVDDGGTASVSAEREDGETVNIVFAAGTELTVKRGPSAACKGE